MYYHQLIIIVIKALYLSLQSVYHKRRNNGIIKYSNVIGCILFNVCRFTVYQSIMVSRFAHFILKERLTMIKVVALVIGVIGVTICLGLDRSLLGWGACVALLGSLCWSCNTVVTKQFKFDKGAWVLTGWRLLFGGIIMFLISQLLGERYHIGQLNGWGWVWFWWLVFPASIGSFGLWFSSLNLRGATISSSFLFLVPLFSTIFQL